MSGCWASTSSASLRGRCNCEFRVNPSRILGDGSSPLDTAEVHTPSASTPSGGYMVLAKRRPGRLGRSVLVTAGLLLALAGSASATTFVRVSDADLADQAPIIVEAVVRGFDYTMTSNMPMTDYQIEVSRVVRGDLPGSAVVVRVHGGRAADGYELEIFGAPRFAENDRVLLFLKKAADGSYRILHVLQGSFRVVENEGRSYAVRDFGQAEELEIAGRTLESERPRELEKFRSWLADRSSGNARPADYYAELSLPQSIQQRYTLLSRDGFNMRWSAFDASQNVTFLAHEAGQPGRTGGGFDDLQTAINAWNNEAVTNIRYRYGGTTTATAGFRNFDGINAVLWDDLEGAGEFDEPFSCGTGGVLAVGGPWFNPNSRHSFAGRSFITIQGADIVTNDGLECWINFSRRAEEVLAHELGHTLGMNHSCGDTASGNCDTNVKNDALMRAQAHGDSRGASLRSDDLAGINILYGTGFGEEPPASPSNLTTSVISGSEIRLFWNDNSSNESSFRVERRTTGSFQEIGATSAGATSYNDLTVASGQSYVYRVRATNDAGGSNYSNEAAATAPGEKAPSNLVLNATGATTAQLTWVDNATSESGYDVEAKLSGALYEVVASLPANTTTATVGGLFSESLYAFRVRAKGGLGNSSYSNEVSGSTLLAPIAACTPSATRTCLNGGRFKVEVKWKDFGGVQGAGQVVPFGSADSGLYYFFSANNWEMLVKVLDGCGINNRFWVYAAATTNVEYTLFVTETASGRTQTYVNPLGTAAAAITDGSAFDTCGTPFTAGEGSYTWEPRPILPLTLPANLAEASAVEPRATCTDTATALCVQGERFKVEVTWTDFVGASGSGQVVPAGTADSGLFYFFSPNNWELLVKVLDGCSINNRVWVLAAATTTVQYSLKVTDMNNPGSPKIYNNGLGVASPAFIDLDAFAACQ